ncbi:unnamed protein product, partial [Didymodactylos carnosus]
MSGARLGAAFRH